MTRVAVIGVGAMGRNHARVYSEMSDVELVGVADTDSEVAEMISNRYGGKAYTDIQQLLDEQRPEAVTIAVPTAHHLDTALQVIRHKIHLLIEKPIALSIEQGKQIIWEAELAGVQLMIGHVERFNPAVVALKEHLQSGEIGQVFQIDARRQGPFPVRVTDVGVVIDLAVHDLDIIRYISGAEVVRIYAETNRLIHSVHEDMFGSLIRLSDGTIGTLTINWLTPTKIRELYVIGERGMFRVDYLTQDLYFYENATVTNGGGWDTLQILRGVSEGRMIRHIITKKEPLRVEQEAFLTAIRGEAPVAASGEDGLKAVELAQAVLAFGVAHSPISFQNET